MTKLEKFKFHTECFPRFNLYQKIHITEMTVNRDDSKDLL